MAKPRGGFLLLHTEEPNAHRYDVFVTDVHVPEDEKRRFVPHASAVSLLSKWRLQKTGYLRFSWEGNVEKPALLKAHVYPYRELSQPEQDGLQHKKLARQLLLKALEHMHAAVGDVPVEFFPATTEGTAFFEQLGIPLDKAVSLNGSLQAVRNHLKTSR